jgi:hypothetical protein
MSEKISGAIRPTAKRPQGSSQLSGNAANNEIEQVVWIDN